MRDQRRSAVLFMVAGLALALAVGVLVRNASDPQRSVTAGYTSTPAPVSQTAASASSSQSRTSRSSSVSPSSETLRMAPPATSRPSTRAAGGSAPAYGIDGATPLNEAQALQPANPSYRIEADPYAPPLATTSAPRSPDPTTVYRPTNVRPERGDDVSQDEPDTPSERTRESSTSQVSPPPTSAGEPTRPAETPKEPTPAPSSEPGQQPGAESVPPAPQQGTPAERPAEDASEDEVLVERGVEGSEAGETAELAAER